MWVRPAGKKVLTTCWRSTRLCGFLLLVASGLALSLLSRFGFVQFSIRLDSSRWQYGNVSEHTEMLLPVRRTDYVNKHCFLHEMSFLDSSRFISVTDVRKCSPTYGNVRLCHCVFLMSRLISIHLDDRRTEMFPDIRKCSFVSLYVCLSWPSLRVWHGVHS